MITIIAIIFLCILFNFIGYKIALIIWKPELLKKTNEILIKNQKDLLNLDNLRQKTNLELLETNKKLDETIKSNANWYIQNINNIGQYLKDKHNDNYVFDQLKNVQGISEKRNYSVDELLDKLSIGGWYALTQDEINYLKNQRDIK